MSATCQAAGYVSLVTLSILTGTLHRSYTRFAEKETETQGG